MGLNTQSKYQYTGNSQPKQVKIKLNSTSTLFCCSHLAKFAGAAIGIREAFVTVAFVVDELSSPLTLLGQYKTIAEELHQLWRI